MAIAAPLSMMSSYVFALSAGAKAANRANTASAPDDPQSKLPGGLDACQPPDLPQHRDDG